MNKCVSFSRAKEIMGDNFIGNNEIKMVSFLEAMEDSKTPSIPYTEEELQLKKDEYLLILGVENLVNGKKVTIQNMQEFFGKNPEVEEPCFYNQDWYNKEDFITKELTCGWYLIRKEVYNDSRAVRPEELVQKYSFPSAVLCVYTFFTNCMVNNEYLWYHDFVWCNDVDHNGDRIYVGKYNDVDGVNKNGFSIHRHLGLRKCYGCID